MNKIQIEKGTLDAVVINRVLAGEIDLYEVIVRRYNGYIYKVGRSYGFSHDDVEDLMQETYVNAYKNLKSFEGRSSLKTWLVKIMLHECFHKKEKFSFKNEKADSEALDNESRPAYRNEISDGNKTVQELELKQIIEKAILRIPEEYRMVFSLRELTGLSTAETSEMLHISEDNVKVRLSRAKKMLQDEIEKSYSVAELFEFNLIYCDGMVERVMRAIKKL